MFFRAFFLSGLIATGVSAQNDASAKADSLLQSGRLDAAALEYAALLQSNPADLHALLGRATALAWSGQFANALEFYGAAITVAPDHLPALLGAGYAHVWGGDHAPGVAQFDRALALFPDNVEAQKGRAYAALWTGRPSEARDRFVVLTRGHPENPDGFVGLAQSFMALRQPGEAERSLSQARTLDPDRLDVKDLSRAVGRMRSPVEVSATLGRSAFDDAGQGQISSTVGIRSVDLVVRPSVAVTLMAQYDDGMSVDTRALAVNDERAPTYRAAAALAWGKRFISRVGGGSRTAPGGDRQTLTEFDQVVVLGRVGLAAGWTGITHSNGPNESVMRLGLNAAVGSRWEVGTTGFFKPSDTGPDGYTGVFTVGHRFDAPVDVNGGFATGRVAVTGLGQHEIFGRISAAVAPGQWLSLSARRQYGAGTDAFTVLAAGFTVGLGRR